MRGFGWTDAPPAGDDKEGLAEDLLGVCDALRIER
jgi:pimeloyl-ACP methyl ester carboxylesterase